MDDGSGPNLGNPDQELRVPMLYQRNSLAMKAFVCRVEQAEDEGMISLHAYVRAVVKLEVKFRPDTGGNNQWQVFDGNPYMPTCVASVIIWLIRYLHGLETFGLRTTLVQQRLTAAADHGWYVVEVGFKHSDLDDS
jgi:hypothetical protein